ncbi:hypothetical protein F503_02537 [Ophiostoma piceae UAMH 11346]|uniref:HNH nuclease domain-containing protein n=1 Tax=Ophiostoma piceae (strain UAMH 11346) TaxID=1262450 RepID=S3BYR7_OPHP1|nr:hypothetical protein F503_02537 [Ophiostoma piceae UAMH 11346]
MSLEEVIDMSSRLVLQASSEPDARETAAVLKAAGQTFHGIVAHFEKIDPYLDIPHPKRCTSYSQPSLILHMYKFALSEESKNLFLRAFFGWMELAMDSNAELDFEKLAPRFEKFAEYLIHSFFLPLKATGGKTPQHSPAPHSAAQDAQGGAAASGFVTTSNRLSSLRYECLVRDRHRCVISHKFDADEYELRYKKDKMNARDDDGRVFDESTEHFGVLEVAHILPHSIMSRGSSDEANAARQATLAILNMLDKGVVHLIEGVEIDRSTNALTLCLTHHKFFGAFDTYFDAVEGQENTYTIKTFKRVAALIARELPVTRTLFVTENRTIDPPLPRLLAVHRAIAHILHLSGAGAYIENVLRDIEHNVVRSDGTTNLAPMIHLSLWGWVPGAVY